MLGLTFPLPPLEPVLFQIFIHNAVECHGFFDGQNGVPYITRQFRIGIYIGWIPLDIAVEDGLQADKTIDAFCTSISREFSCTGNSFTVTCNFFRSSTMAQPNGHPDHAAHVLEGATIKGNRGGFQLIQI